MALTGTYVPSATEWVRKNVEEYEASNGEEGGTLPGTPYPVVVITSVGASSGNLRKNPVMRVERDGAYLAVASKGGAPDDPAWADNFRKHPEVDLQDKAEKHTYRVRELDGAEYDDWWKHAVATWSTYADYKKKTDRKIPLFLLERA
ncbi:nitroreductase family deazaflavin-dependent oxidoreductase [Nocardioides glacieisoli]|uniref:Nitroreductase family deazaflavin-dependent oxidoreductase n=1 Tax=Nocardioides glacieisoli TaxID=1168730 RepID=A0A4Q2RKA3_9ACTN|nr:nitroreductase family deazaflavin-dependent oxidoreductase [Nocardioides glacieisoli]RYB89160.1 nitroreductase family deazaflavin-dependent oxidoreductase [Nocardioides glacieisoli]